MFHAGSLRIRNARKTEKKNLSWTEEDFLNGLEKCRVSKWDIFPENPQKIPRCLTKKEFVCNRKKLPGKAHQFATGNGGHFAGRYSLLTPGQIIPGLAKKTWVNHKIFPVRLKIPTWKTGLQTGGVVAFGHFSSSTWHITWLIMWPYRRQMSVDSFQSSSLVRVHSGHLTLDVSIWWWERIRRHYNFYCQQTSSLFNLLSSSPNLLATSHSWKLGDYGLPGKPL